MREPSDVRTLARGAVVALAGRMTGRGIHVLTQVVLGRALGPAAFGVYGIGWTLLRVVGLMVPLGLDHGVIRFGRAHWGRNSDMLRSVVRRALLLATVSGIVVAAIGWVAAPWLEAHWFRHEGVAVVLRVLSPAVVLYAAVRVAAAASRISQRMGSAVMIEDVIPSVVNLVVATVLVWLGFGLVGAAIAVTMSLVVGLLAGVNVLGRGLPVASAPAVAVGYRELLAFSLPAALAGSLGMLIIWMDRLMVGALMPAQDAGVYFAMSQSTVVFGLVVSAFNAIMQPMIPDLQERGARERLNDVYRLSTKWALYGSLPLAIILLVFPGPVMRVAFGSAYGGASLALKILTVGQIVNVGTGGVGMVMIMTGHQREWLWYSSASLSTNIGLNALLIPRFGLAGASAATAIALIVMFGGGLLRLRQLLGVWPYDIRLAKGLTGALVATGAILLLHAVPLPEMVLVAAACIVAFTAFWATVVALGLDPEDRSVMIVIQRRLLRFSRSKAGGL